MSQFLKDPAAVLDYKLDLSSWLSGSEVISTHTVTADTGLTVDSSSQTDTNTSITAWLSGGTAGTDYNVVFQWTTDASRTDERTVVIKVENR